MGAECAKKNNESNLSSASNSGSNSDNVTGTSDNDNVVPALNAGTDTLASTDSLQVAGSESAGHAGNAVTESDPRCDELYYGEQKIADIAQTYVERDGSPIKGDRHRSLIKVAGHFRYLVDNNPEKLKMALRTLLWVREWEAGEQNASEIDAIADEVCEYRMWREIPKQLAECLQASSGNGNSGGAKISKRTGESIVSSDGQEFWNRLRPLMEDDPLYSLCVSSLADDNKIAGIFVAGGMLCTLATRTHYLHYDGRQHRMNPQVFIIGKPASGKSFADEFDNAIMAVLRAADEPGRKKELQYKKEQKKRRTSNKASKGEKLLDEPEECIRYIPSRTSNAVFYKRQMNAKALVGNEVMPLHLYTFDSELDSSVAAQSGGSWIGKHDLELKAFHNEFSGVDYANSDSVNEVIQVFWNQVVTGTDVSLSKKINLRNVNDGLCSRIAICRLVSDDFSMIRKGDYTQQQKKMDELKRWGEFFDSLEGELIIPKLVDHVYRLCEKAARAASVKQDHVLDYLRKRAVFYAIWFTIPRIVGRCKCENEKGADMNVMKPVIKESDLKFAEVIFDSIIYYQDVFFGRMLEDSWQTAQNTFVVRPNTRSSRNEELFEMLPKEFTIERVTSVLDISKHAAQQQCRRWVERNLITKEGKRGFKKTVL